MRHVRRRRIPAKTDRSGGGGQQRTRLTTLIAIAAWLVGHPDHYIQRSELAEPVRTWDMIPAPISVTAAEIARRRVRATCAPRTPPLPLTAMRGRQKCFCDEAVVDRHKVGPLRRK